MRVLIINTDYGAFLSDLYGDTPGLLSASYDDQLRIRNDSLFGVADFYSRAFRDLGHEAWEVHSNNAALQAAWLRTQGLVLRDYRERRADAFETTIRKMFGRRVGDRLARTVRRFVPPPDIPPKPFSPLRACLEPADLDLLSTLVAQARTLRPDVILNQSVSEILPWQLDTLRPYTKLLVGQIASPLPDDVDFRTYDLMISSLPNFVAHFRALGVPAALNRLGFGTPVLEKLSPVPSDIPVSFMGSITPDHASRFALLEELARRTNIAVWGRMASVPDTSPLWPRYRAPAWGRDMYQVLMRSEITINQHIDIAGGHANNMRLYEATGVGTFLLTDWTSDLGEIFEPGVEVACYRSADECVDLIKYYGMHEAERTAIARAGQRRVLETHTFHHRVAELVRLFDKHLKS